MTDLFRISVRGAGRSARDFDDLQRAIQDELNREIRGLGRLAEKSLRSIAPEDTSDLVDTIKATVRFRAIRPRVTIHAEFQGHRSVPFEADYAPDPAFADINVTRYGHRQSELVPRHARVLRIHPAGRRNPQIIEYRSSVRGASPNFDWVRVGTQPVEAAAEASSRALARRFETRTFGRRRA